MDSNLEKKKFTKKVYRITYQKMTGETPEVPSVKRRREEREEEEREEIEEREKREEREEREERSWKIMEHHGISWIIMELRIEN